MTKTDALMQVVEEYVNVWVPSRRAALRAAIEQALSEEWENGRCAGVELNKQALEDAVAQERERCAKLCEDLFGTRDWLDLIEERTVTSMCAAAIRKGTP